MHCKKVIIICLFVLAFTQQGCTQTTNPDKKEYLAIADKICKKIVALSDKYYPLQGISMDDKYITEDTGKTIIRIYWKDAHSRTLPASDYYLIFDLYFYLCDKAEKASFADKDLSIGDMEVSLSISGKGNEEMQAEVEKIIKEEKASFEKKHK